MKLPGLDSFIQYFTNGFNGPSSHSHILPPHSPFTQPGSRGTSHRYPPWGLGLPARLDVPSWTSRSSGLSSDHLNWLVTLSDPLRFDVPNVCRFCYGRPSTTHSVSRAESKHVYNTSSLVLPQPVEMSIAVLCTNSPGRKAQKESSRRRNGRLL